MLENYFDEEEMEIGFIMPSYKDGIILLLLDDESNFFYRLLILLFHLLGTYQIRFFQAEYSTFYQVRFGKTVERRVIFQPRNWHPLSIVSNIIFSIIHHIVFIFTTDTSLKKNLRIFVKDGIVIDVDKNNKAYIDHIDWNKISPSKKR